MTADKRQHERHSVLRNAILRIDDKDIGCRIIDISVGGARVQSDRDCKTGSTASIVLENFGEFPGTVAWSRDKICGIKFTGDQSAIAESLMGIATYG
ncbi:MAG: PilZ domain-containing protein [Rhodospirillales bacterium]|nr:PilZ domain-containing protein [Rhodospirillales bacterium]